MAEHPEGDEQGENEEEDEEWRRRERSKSDVRSIRSVTSMMQESRRERRDLRDRDREKDKDKDKEEGKERVSLSDRLASIGVLGRLGGSPDLGSSAVMGDSQSIKAAGFLANFTVRSASASISQPAQGSGPTKDSTVGVPDNAVDLVAPSLDTTLPVVPQFIDVEPIIIDPPLERFMTCDLGDIHLSEVYDLLRDYRRLGAAVNALKERQTSAVQ